MEQNLEELGERLDVKATSAMQTHSAVLEYRIQLAQAEQLQGIRKALEGIVRAMRGPDFTMEIKSTTSGKAHVKHTRTPDMPETPPGSVEHVHPDSMAPTD